MSSPVVWGTRIFLTGADDSSRQIYCFDADSGKLLWRHDVDGLPGFPSGSELPRVLDEAGFAAPTATTDGEHVAAIFATGELVCVNMKGERAWAKHLGVPENQYGHSSSLLSHKKLLFVQYDQKVNSKLLAFDLASGRPAWQAKRDAISWSSPILIENQGRMELVLVSSKAVDSYDPLTGELFWSVKCLDGEVASSAAYADGIVFVANEGAAMSAIDIKKHGAEPTILWQRDENLPDAASPLAKDDFLILPTAFGVVTCLEARSGKVLWEQEFDKGFCSSPVAVGDRIYLVDTSGSTQAFQLDDEFKLLGVSGIGEGVYATPAFVGDRIYIRGLRHLFCVGAEGQ
jgi:outer membrane protein assembly factor BamB